jgi:hypothetical protein
MTTLARFLKRSSAAHVGYSGGLGILAFIRNYVLD